MKVGIKIAKIAKIRDQRSPVDTKERASAIPHCEVATATVHNAGRVARLRPVPYSHHHRT